jgi:general secretion pathway protein G
MQLRRRQPNRKGFTLLELLLVVGILVMLAAFALPSFLGTQEQAQKDAAIFQIDTFDKALKLYRTHNSMFPTTDQGLTALREKPRDEPIPKRWVEYLDEDLPLDPWGNDYQYAYPGEHNKKRPDIWSTGPDGEEGTDDDIGNWKSESDSEDSETAVE